MNKILINEELYWKQRVTIFWLNNGDSNSRFFHAYTITRKKLNHVTKLKNEDGDVVIDHEVMCQVVKEFRKAVWA